MTMTKYYVVGTIILCGEYDADNEVDAIAEFEQDHTYQHESGMTIRPVVEEVEVLDD